MTASVPLGRTWVYYERRRFTPWVKVDVSSGEAPETAVELFRFSTTAEFWAGYDAGLTPEYVRA